METQTTCDLCKKDQGATCVAVSESIVLPNGKTEIIKRKIRHEAGTIFPSNSPIEGCYKFQKIKKQLSPPPPASSV